MKLDYAAAMPQRSLFSERHRVLSPRALIWGIFFFCCVLPIAWMLLALITTPSAWFALSPISFHAALLGRTLLYGFIVAILACLFAWPIAIVLGKSSNLIAGMLGFILPLALLLPSIVYGYGWVQLLWLTNTFAQNHGWLPFHFHLFGYSHIFKSIVPIPGSIGDIARCVFTLSTWLWPIPAGIVGLSLRRLDTDLQQQALLDGAYWRVISRQLITPALAGFTVVAILAMQEYAIYEPNGISVVATEVRTVFVTGEPGSLATPINSVTSQSPFSYNRHDQGRNAAAAIVTALPLLIVTALLSWLVLALARRQETADSIDLAPRPRVLRPGWISRILTMAVIVVTLVIPIVTMASSIHRHFSLDRSWRTFSPEVLGAMQLGLFTGIVAVLLGAAALIRRSTAPGVLGLITFLIGGPLLAIALIRLYNQQLFKLDVWVCNGPIIAVMAYVARFGWLAMWAAQSTWQSRWRSVREMAAVDGAGAVATAWYVVWPLAWPLMAACGVLVMLLAMTEVPATIILYPLNPPAFTPQLMTWVHTLGYDDMLEGSLLLAATVLVMGGAAVALGMFARSRFIAGGWRASGYGVGTGTRRAAAAAKLVCLVIIPFLFLGCGRDDSPKAIWLETGAGEGQVVYPRAICYSKSDDTFFVCDRMARIQHLDHNGNFLSGWRMPEFAQGKPVGLSVGPDGNLWVPDTHYSRVMVFSPQGKLLKQFGSFGREKGQFIYPSDIAFDSKGRIFVSEFGDHDRIQVFDQNFNYLYEFGRFGDGDGEFSRPQSMVIEGTTMYITDACNHRIAVFTTDGRFIRNMGTIGSGLGQFRFPYGLDMDSKGRLVVCEFGNNRVQLIDKESGRGIEIWGRGGREPGQLAYPWGVAVDKTDRVVAVDAGNNRLQVFEF